MSLCDFVFLLFRAGGVPESGIVGSWQTPDPYLDPGSGRAATVVDGFLNSCAYHMNLDDSLPVSDLVCVPSEFGSCFLSPWSFI